MRKFSILAATVLILLFLCSYGKKISEGVIYEKEYKPAYSYTWVQYIMSGKVLVPIFHREDVPNRWYVYIYQEEGAEKKTACWEVTKEEYDSYEVGDYFVAK